MRNTVGAQLDNDTRIKIRIERLRVQLERLEAEGQGDTLSARSLRAQLRIDRAAVGFTTN